MKNEIEPDSFYKDFSEPEIGEEDNITLKDLEDIDDNEYCKACGHQGREVCNDCYYLK